MLTITKSKIGVTSLVLASFVLGAFTFTVYQADAFGGFHRFGFFGGGCDLSGLERGTPEWQAKLDECKVERQEKMEERKAEMGAWKNMTPEERQVKLEELKESGEWTMPGHRFGHSARFGGFKGAPIESE